MRCHKFGGLCNNLNSATIRQHISENNKWWNKTTRNCKYIYVLLIVYILIQSMCHQKCAYVYNDYLIHQYVTFDCVNTIFLVIFSRKGFNMRNVSSNEYMFIYVANVEIAWRINIQLFKVFFLPTAY